MPVRDEWDDKFQKWKAEKQRKLVREAQVYKEEVREQVKEIAQEIKREEKIIVKRVTPEYVRILKIIVILIPILIFGYLIYANFLVNRDFNTFYDIGGAQDVKKPVLTPVSRMSDIVNASGSEPSFRRIKSGLVYFNVAIPRGAENIRVTARFKDNLLNNTDISIGAKDRTDWHYKYNAIYKGKAGQEWIVNSTEFNIKNDGLVVVNNQLSMLFNIPSLYNEKNQNYTVPIDWINVSVQKPGLFEKWGGNG